MIVIVVSVRNDEGHRPVTEPQVLEIDRECITEKENEFACKQTS